MSTSLQGVLKLMSTCNEVVKIQGSSAAQTGTGGQPAFPPSPESKEKELPELHEEQELAESRR